jgi:hypothetical protein
METNWTAIASAEILPGRSIQAITNHYHRDLKNGPETSISNEGDRVYDALQVLYNEPIAFDLDRAANVLATSEIVREKMKNSATLKRLVEALSCAEPLAMHDALQRNRMEITASRKGPVDTDHWAFCICDEFIPVQIDTMMHSAFKTGSFSIDSIFAPSVCVKRTLSARRSKKFKICVWGPHQSVHYGFSQKRLRHHGGAHALQPSRIQQ